jgi:hypothetical protein
VSVSGDYLRSTPARRDRDAAEGRRLQDEAPQPLGRGEGGVISTSRPGGAAGIRRIPRGREALELERLRAGAASPASTWHRRSTSRRSSCCSPDRREGYAEDPYIRTGLDFLPARRSRTCPRTRLGRARDLLNVTDGNIIDYDEILEKLREIRGFFQLEMVAYDPHQATMMVTTMMKEGFPVLEYRPIVLNFSEPMKELDALTKARTIAHGGCPVMEWEMSNVVAAPDKKDNVYPNKPAGQDHLKIDNPVALISALGVAMSGERQEQSFWEVA